jgi:hypothetical protein
VYARLELDGDTGDTEPFSWKGVVAALKDPLVVACAYFLFLTPSSFDADISLGPDGWLFHGFAFPLYSLSLFLPTIIAGLGYASWKAQLMTV